MAAGSLSYIADGSCRLRWNTQQRCRPVAWLRNVVARVPAGIGSCGHFRHFWTNHLCHDRLCSDDKLCVHLRNLVCLLRYGVCAVVCAASATAKQVGARSVVRSEEH